MTKSDKIKSILDLSAGKSFKVLKARPQMNFTLIDRTKNLFVNDQTGEEVTWYQIQERYIIDPNRIFWGMCGVGNCPDGDDFYFTTVWLSSVHKDEVIFFDEPFIYNPDIALNLNDYVDKDQVTV